MGGNIAIEPLQLDTPLNHRGAKRIASPVLVTSMQFQEPRGVASHVRHSFQ